MALYVCILMLSVFWGSVSQILLKKAALKEYASKIKEYMNPLVIIGYIIMFGTTFLSIFAYRKVPLSMGPVIQATSYIYVTIFGRLFFGEKTNSRKLTALAVIIAGVVIFSLGRQ